ncbi:MAG: bifunctional diguanylate cyclase/phosphodiesterase [Pyrinomonadaceae bacterium]|nr:bifunctional diguanylate cyclase/phosphodiesterase [Pyrinomonadaceae bacterium]
MEKKDPIFNVCLALFAVAAFASTGWAAASMSTNRLDAGVVVLAVLVIALGAFLKTQIERFDLHLVLSNALVMVVMFNYGAEIGVLAAAVVFVAIALILRLSGGIGDLRGLFASSAIAVISAAAAWQCVKAMFGSTEIIMERHDLTSMIWFVAVSTIAMFAVNALLNWVLFKFASIPDPRRGFDRFMLDSLLLYVLSGLAAGVGISGLEHMNVYVLTGVTGFLGLVFWTYRRYVSDINTTADRARSSERRRAETAESRIRGLETYVEELEQTTETLQQSHESFRHAAFHDALTGLPNRNYYMDRLKELLAQCREKSETNFAILLLDLTRFKTINDSLGHSMGDRLIKDVGKRLAEMIREDDMVARFSGDKFGVILTDLMVRDEAMSFAERLSKRVAEPYSVEGRQVFTSVKIGIAFGNSKYQEAEDILRDADIAMYYAKDNNEPYVIFDQKMHIRAVTRMQLETDLRYAIERKEFELYYQPIIGLSDVSLVGFEALVRWNHPQRGLIPPNEFIPISESTGIIIPMTIQILHSACSQVARWQSRNPNGVPLSVAVNLSGKHFGHPNLVDQINAVLYETGISPKSLKLELTESAIMENAETAILMLKEIKKTGVQISIDDFGTGYSSLSYLHKFPIDLLKVDRSFVSAMEENTENGEIVKTVIALAKALKLSVVAEGIESIHQFHQLRNLNCEYGQGYLFSKPLPVAEIEKLLLENNRWRNILPATGMPIIPQSKPQELPHLRLA